MSLQPYSVLGESADNARDIGLLLGAAQVINAYCGQPLHRRHAEMRLDLYDGFGISPCPLHSVLDTELDGERLAADELIINQSNISLRRISLNAGRQTLRIEGLMGFGGTVALSGYSVSGSELHPPPAGRPLPLGTVLYNAGSPVHVEAIKAAGVMQLSGIHGTAVVEVWRAPAALRTAAQSLTQALSLFTSTAALGDERETAQLVTAEIAGVLQPYRAQFGGVSSYGPAPERGPNAGEGDEFGPGFGRGFD